MIAMGQSREVENSENRYYTSSNTSRIEPYFNTDIRLTIGMAVDELSNLGEGDNTLKDLKIYYHIKEENNTKILESRGQFSYVEYDTNAVVTTFCADVSATEVDDLYTSWSDFNIPLIVYSIDKLLKYFLYHFGLCQTKFKCIKIIFVNDSNNSEEYASTEKLNEDFCEIVINLHSMKYLEECLGAFVHEFGHFLGFFVQQMKTRTMVTFFMRSRLRRPQ
ncbi:uncharacterized protein LOC132736193 [Ruditapes philippinarum]|uniref:uncharacterized protein LOC132736193 n=1 Tax=Ruditapes philippinarum TaxID=129788 RepID=UPI00295BF06C|nr:uncharacterized protein LOC132736193 [Ruditapes philippinarum]